MNPGMQKKGLLFVIIILAIKVFLFPPFQLQLRSEEPRRAVISMEMIFSGNYIEPQIHGWDYYNKPPLFNWLVAIFMIVFQSFDEWVVRLPGLLSHLMLSLCIYFFARRYVASEIAVLSSLFYLTAGEILFYGSVIAGQIDLFFSLLVFIQLAYLFKALHKNDQYALYISYLFLALGIMTKGIPAIAFQVLTVIGWIIIKRLKWKDWMFAHHLMASMIPLGLIAIYFWVYHSHGGHSDVYLINLFYEAAQKSALETEGGTLMKSFIQFPGTFLKLLLPWTLLFLFFLNRSVRSHVFRSELALFSLVVITSNILLYWFSGYITSRYLFPFIPFLAIVAATAFNPTNKNLWLKYFYGFILLLVMIAPPGLIAFFITNKEANISHIWFKIFISMFVSTGVIIFFRKYPADRIFLAIFFILCLKWYSQWTYYPTRYADERINSLIAQIPILFQYSRGTAIHLLGKPEQHHIDISLGKWSLISRDFEDPMPLSYQLPYYIERRQQEVMQFHTELQPNRYYLVRKENIDAYDSDSYQVIYEFVDDWKRIPLNLIKT
ncbi:MAG: glycosyltransferase family 39 protein [Saprospiraceae bacterium]|nr:glycosyltransferase family 39 protein [Saprospiraceae bacterium]